MPRPAAAWCAWRCHCGCFPRPKSTWESSAKSAKDDGELSYLLGVCEEGTGDYEEAVKAYEEARKQEPTRIETYARLANLYRTQLKDAAEADRVMDAQERRRRPDRGQSPFGPRVPHAGRATANGTASRRRRPPPTSRRR